MPHLPLSIIVHTRNEARQIEACLAGLRDWASEVILADMESSDGTAALARPHVTGILEVPYIEEFDQARNLSAEVAREPWILYLDADERLTPEVRETIEAIVLANDPDISAYQIPFKVVSFGSWIQHAGNWWPSYKSPPLLRTGRFRFSGHVHGPAIVDGTTVRVAPRSENDAILHFSHADITQYFDKLNRYTGLEARKRAGQPAPSWEEVAHSLGTAFAWYFDDTEGWRDGGAGFLLSFGSAVYEAVGLLKHAESCGQIDAPPSAEAFLRVAAEAAARPGSNSFPEFEQRLEDLVPGLRLCSLPAKAEIKVVGKSFGLDWESVTPKPKVSVGIMTHAHALDVLGGGEVQLFETVRTASSHGVRFSIGIGELPTCVEFCHIFSLHHGYRVRALHRSGVPYVLSPIYWDRAELAWLAPRILALAARAETLAELASGFDCLRTQRDQEEASGNFVSRLPDEVKDLILGACMVLPNACVESAKLAASIGEALPRIRIIPNAAPRFENAQNIEVPELPDGRFVLCAGRIEINKNQLALCLACRMAKVPLVLIGTEVDPTYATHCRAIGGEWVRFLGRQPRSTVHAAMRRSVGHALPSFAETPGLASLEAQALGCPILCSTRGAEREIFGSNALYCDPLDIEGLVEGVRALASSERPSQVKRLATWDDVGRQTASVYKEALRKS